jgi:hypothetical protein
MKAWLSFIILFLAMAKGYSQFELPKKTLKIAPVSNPKGQVAPTSSKLITYPSIFDKKDKLLESVSLLNRKIEPEKSIMEKEQFENPAKQYTEKMNNQLKTEGMTSEVVNSDFFFGEFKVTTYKIIIACRDSGAIDGDDISIWLNGEKVIPIVYLDTEYKKYEILLKDGLNDVQIEALNTGLLFPNTGQFVYFDGNEKLVTNQQWNLNAGYKAIVKIRKIKGITEEQK